MIGKSLIGMGSGLAESIADVSGISNFTSALGGEKSQSKKAAKVKAFDEDESPTKILQRILTEVQTIHKVMASQVVPPSEKEEIQRDKDKKDDEVLKALEDLRPEEEKKEKKEPWWKRLLLKIAPFFFWILNPKNWLKFLPTIPGFAKFALLILFTAYTLSSDTLKCFFIHFFLSSGALSAIGPLDSFCLGTAVRINGLYFPINLHN